MAKADGGEDVMNSTRAAIARAGRLAAAVCYDGDARRGTVLEVQVHTNIQSYIGALSRASPNGTQPC